MHEKVEKKQLLQEKQYEYPYHYIPEVENGEFTQVKYWSWGFKYLGGQQVVLDQLKKIFFKSLVDVGCGDGRFIREADKRFSDMRFFGIDYSERAIGLARAMNPLQEYRAMDVMSDSVDEKFDVATLLEVLEHIPTDKVSDFINHVSNLIKENGYLILTVPHKSVPLLGKHYQHFSSEQVKELLSPFFRDITVVPFDTRSRLLGFLHKLIGGEGEHFVVTNQKLNRFFWKMYTSRFLYSDSEDKSMRIAVTCQKR